MLRTSRCYDACEEKVVLGNELKQWRFDREQYREFIGPLADSIFDFAHSMSKLQLDSAEFSLLTAIAIFSGKLYAEISFQNLVRSGSLLLSLSYLLIKLLKFISQNLERFWLSNKTD